MLPRPAPPRTAPHRLTPPGQLARRSLRGVAEQPCRNLIIVAHRLPWDGTASASLEPWHAACSPSLFQEFDPPRPVAGPAQPSPAQSIPAALRPMTCAAWWLATRSVPRRLPPSRAGCDIGTRPSLAGPPAGPALPLAPRATSVVTDLAHLARERGRKGSGGGRNGNTTKGKENDTWCTLWHFGQAERPRIGGWATCNAGLRGAWPTLRSAG